MGPLCFGGSFNPVHQGHLICARAVAETAGYDRVLLIPARQPPHKQGDTTIATAEHRLAMCRLAVAGDTFFEVSDLELHRPGPSFTIDTVRQLKSAGWSTVSWLIGADMLLNLPTWHKTAELLPETNFVIMARPGWAFDWANLPEPYRYLKDHVVISPLVDLSSTMIRQRIRVGRPINYLTPPAVVDYIRENNLYL